MGGWGFPAGRGPREGGVWRDFPPSRWVIPALTLTSAAAETHLALVAEVGPSSEASPLRASYRTLVKGLEPRPTDGREGPDAGTAPLPPMKSARSIAVPEAMALARPGGHRLDLQGRAEEGGALAGQSP